MIISILSIVKAYSPNLEIEIEELVTTVAAVRFWENRRRT
ncbi:hypothetical protein NNO_1423 [Hydrogenimonas sp.]|nr:hypothetical protein NNO_1423 [Hydrogenimonas sp.]